LILKTQLLTSALRNSGLRLNLMSVLCLVNLCLINNFGVLFRYFLKPRDVGQNAEAFAQPAALRPTSALRNTKHFAKRRWL